MVATSVTLPNAPGEVASQRVPQTIDSAQATRRCNCICTMIGAREHYALPRALNRLGALSRLYTDVWAGTLLRQLRFGPSLLRSLAARHHPDLPNNKVVAFTTHSLWMQRPRPALKSMEEQYREFAQDGRSFALSVNRHLERNWTRIQPGGLVAYNTGCLETQQLLADRGIWSVVDQIDPARVEEEIVYAEAEKWPGWQKVPGRIPDEYFRRLQSEWQLAQRVIVNSVWSRTALIRQGVPAEKIAVIPLCYEASPTKAPRRTVGSEPTLTVLWVGQVILRKGIQYLIEAAKALQHPSLRFVVAGPLGISKEAIASAPRNMEFVGPVSRDRVAQLYAGADLFVIPTLSDGFAITQLEAMAYGLPVVATRHCGEVVCDGENGRLIPAADPQALACAIEQLAADRRALALMSVRARETVQRFSIAHTAHKLNELLHELPCF